MRPIRGLLADAMAECIEVPATAEGMHLALNTFYTGFPSLKKKRETGVFTLIDQGRDERIGWDSYLLCLNGKAEAYTNTPIPGLEVFDSSGE